MSRVLIRLVLPLAAAVAGGCAIAVWLRSTQLEDMPPRLPKDRPAARLSAADETVRNTGTLIPGTGVPSTLSGSWPQFRGADRSNIAHDVPALARSWPPGGPRLLWELEAGEGHSGAAVHNGRVYMMDYDREKHEDVVRCLSLDDGQEIWRYTYYVKVKRNHGMSRTVPAVTDDYVVTLGPKCHVVCLDARSGELVWKRDLVQENASSVPPWYAGQCPLIDGDRVILAPGGSPLMEAVDLATGEPVWETPNPGGWGMTHSSIVSADGPAGPQFVYCATQGVVGVAPDSGELLWTSRDWKITLANVPSPLPIGDGRVLFSGGYNSGAAMLRLDGSGGLEWLWRSKPRVFGSDQQTPILYDGHVYGVIPGGQLVCLTLDGEVLWQSGTGKRFGLGPYVMADGLLFVLNDQEGTLHMIEASPNGYNELAVAKVLDGHDAWAPIAIAAGRMILRDLTRVVCLELPVREGD